jgi:hypothetical protein
MTGSTIVALVSPVVAVIVAAWGFQRSSRADRLRAFFELQQCYLDVELRAGRRLMYREIAGRKREELSLLPPDISSKISYTLSVMNSIAIACEGNYVDRELVVRGMGRSFAGAIVAGKPYIDYLQEVRGFRPYPFAERLADQLGNELAVVEKGAGVMRMPGCRLIGPRREATHSPVMHSVEPADFRAERDDAGDDNL